MTGGSCRRSRDILNRVVTYDAMLSPTENTRLWSRTTTRDPQPLRLLRLDNNDLYESGARYYDFDQDGFYDAYASYSDLDGEGCMKITTSIHLHETWRDAKKVNADRTRTPAVRRKSSTENASQSDQR